jgi:hypothetical protein
MSHRLAFCHRTPFFRPTASTRRLASKMSVPAQNGIRNGITSTPVKRDRSNLIPFSSRLNEGRALAQDVWSIYKYVHFAEVWN